MHADFCPKGPTGITLCSVGKWMGCTDCASSGSLGLKARETEAGSPHTLRLCESCHSAPLSPWKRSRVSQSRGLPAVFRDLSVSVCLSFALVEVYTDPAYIRGGGGLHLVWTLRGMGARGNMGWGPGALAGGWSGTFQRVGS